MSEKRTGLHSVLSVPAVYSFFIRLIGGDHARRTFVETYLCPLEGKRILDIGCGAGDLLPFLPAVDYVGFDMSPAYIAAARARFGERGTFFCQRVEERSELPAASFDYAVAFGILHHVDDDGATRLFQTCRSLLKPGGRLVTFDNCWTPDQSKLARWIISKDRGKAVRTPQALEQLSRDVFRDVRVYVRHDLLRIPYTHVILDCSG